jgi:dTDP-4-dehydrorhamnose reductase
MSKGRFIIVGASGLIGAAVFTTAMGRQVIGTFATKPKPGLVRFDLVRDDLLDLVPDLGPDDCVILLAAMIDQSWVETHPIESSQINVDGTVKCAAAAIARGAYLLFVSSEAVFGAGSEDGCAEYDSVAPLSLYAQQKVIVEDFIRSMRRPWCIVRTGSVAGWTAKCRCTICKTYEALLKPNAQMAFDTLFTITDVWEVARWLLRLVETRTTGIVHLAANPPLTRTLMAEWIMESSGYREKMAYTRVPFSALSIIGARGAMAWLRSSRAEELGITFTAPRLLTGRKVSLLDQMEAVAYG